MNICPEFPRKKLYHSFQEAQTEIILQAPFGKLSTGEKLICYSCSACGGWHLARKKI